MNFKLELDHETKIVKLKATCLLNQDIRKEILATAAEQLRINAFSKVLIDLKDSKFDSSEKMMGALELINFMREIGIKPYVKFAFIYSDGESHRKYFESVAQQFGGYSLKYFRNFNDAERWLAQLL